MNAAVREQLADYLLAHQNQVAELLEEIAEEGDEEGEGEDGAT
ncbi:MAG: hypothetical protein O9256_00290 [Rhizobiaceae bacterium]|nr:hypothetical protein [Rhizobiaceae bacterium]MCZ8351216.1 hypothetical protein [Rhizobium sp.]